MAMIVHCEEGCVCGCPEWWGLCPDPDIASIETSEVLDSDNADKQETWQKLSIQAGKVLTCFFWYHTGSCAKLRDFGRCPFLHEVQPDMFVEPPPGYMHYSPCELPLCPLRVGSSVTVWPGMTQAEKVSTGDAAAREGKRAKMKRWKERIKMKKQKARLLGASVAQKAPNWMKRSAQGGQQQWKKVPKKARISLHGRSTNVPDHGPPPSPESGELFSDEEPPDEDWYLSGFPDDNVADADCGAMEVMPSHEDRVLQPGDVVEGPDIITAMWYAADRGKADAPA